MARVQLSIINALGQLPSSRHIEAAIKDLNSELMDVSKVGTVYTSVYIENLMTMCIILETFNLTFYNTCICA